MTTPSPKPRRRWFRRVCACTLLLIALVGAAAVLLVYWYTRPAQVIPVVEQTLAELSGCDVTIEDAQVYRDGRIKLEGVSLRLPNHDGEYARLVEARELVLFGEVKALLNGAYQPHRVEARGLVVWLTEDAQSGAFNYEQLAIPQDQEEVLDTAIPAVVLHDAAIRFGLRESESEKITLLDEMHLAGQLNAEDLDNRRYVFALHETLPRGQEPDPDGAAFTGGFSLAQPHLDLTVDRFSLAEEHRYFVPTEFRALWGRLAPGGGVSRLVLHLRPDAHNRLTADGARLEMDFEDIGLNLDILGAQDPDLKEAALLLSTVETRLTDLCGKLILEDCRWRFEHATGQMRQVGLALSPIGYQIQAEGGLSLTEPYRIQIDTKPFTLRRRFEFLLAFSPLTGEAYRLFRPSGEFALSATFVSQADQPQPDWAIQLQIRDGQMAHELFPLPLNTVRGVVEITADQVRINNITGRTPSGGFVTVAGTATPASDIAEVQLTVQIDDLPIDEHLRAVLQPGERDTLARFFDERAYTSLQEQGLISPTGRDAPRFALGGTLDVHVPVYRAYGPDAGYRIVPVLDLAGVQTLMTDFPYPVTVTSGRVAIGADFVEIDRLELSGLTGGALALNGRAELDPTAGDYLPELMLTDCTLPVDPLLLSAIGGEAQALLHDLGVSGLLSVAGLIGQAPGDDEVNLELDVVLTQGSAAPFSGEMRIDEVQGSLQLHTDAIPQMHFTGAWRDGATLTAEGSVHWAVHDPATGQTHTDADLRFTAERFFFDRALLGLLPEGSPTRQSLTELYDAYEPEAVFDATLAWRPTSRDRPDAYEAWLTPDHLALNLLGGRLTMQSVQGQAYLNPEVLRLEAMRGVFQDPDGARGHLSAEGTVRIADHPDIRLALTGSTDAIGQTARLLLPTATTSVLESIAWDGGFEMRDAWLEIVEVGSDWQATRFDGTAAFQEVAMHLAGLEITQAQAELAVHVDATPDRAVPRMSFELDAPSLAVLDRPVTGLRGRADNFARQDLLRTDRITGSMYGGTVVVEAAFGLGGIDHVSVNASVHDVHLEPFMEAVPTPGLDPDRLPVPAAVGHRDRSSGLFSGEITVVSGYQGNAGRHGRGSIRIQDAQLYGENPLGLGMVELLNFNLPTGQGFDNGKILFAVIDDAVQFSHITLRTPPANVTGQVLELNGTGTMTLPDLQLDLQFRTERGGAPFNFPLSGLFSSLRSEIFGIQVSGTLTKPERRYTILQNTRDTLNQMIIGQPRIDPAP